MSTEKKRLPTAKVTSLNIGEIVHRADTSKTNEDLYANHAQIVIGGNELIIDFYRLTPSAADNKNVNAVYLQRIIVPVAMAKGLASALVGGVKAFEKEMGVTLPDSRGKMEGDDFNLWDKTE